MDQSVRNLELPQQRESRERTAEEKSVAAFSESKGWTIMKKALEAKMEHYRYYLPGGSALADLPASEQPSRYMAAATIIQEFDKIIKEVEGVKEVVRAAKNS